MMGHPALTYPPPLIDPVDQAEPHIEPINLYNIGTAPFIGLWLALCQLSKPSIHGD